MEKKVNVEESKVTWKGQKVTGSHNGTIKLKSGEFELDGEKLVSGQFIMDMTSLEVTDLSGEGKEKLEGHLNSEDFFGVEKYPTSKLVIKDASLKSEKTYGVVANLTIKETTKPITFDLNLEEESASADLRIDRTKYNIRYGSGSFFDNLGDNTIYDTFHLRVDLKF